MYQVCTKYCGTIISLTELISLEEAEEFVKHPFVMFYKDEFDKERDDDVIYPDEMWIEEALPFTDSPSKTEWKELEDAVELPF